MKRKLCRLAAVLVILPFAVTVLLPLWMSVTGSFLSTEEAVLNLAPILGSETAGYAAWPVFPHYPTMKSYVELLLDSPNFFLMFWNSCRQVLPVLVGHCLIAVPAAWAFARYKFAGRQLLFFLYMLLMIMPFQVTMVSSYLVLDRLHLMDTHAAIVLPACFAAFPVFLMTQFLKGIPEEVFEAARIDGAGEFGAFIRIGVPLGIPGICSMLVLDFLEYWNALEAPLTFLKTQSKWPLSLFLSGIDTENAGLSLAASIIMMTPALLIFLLGQSYLEQGIMASGIKG